MANPPTDVLEWLLPITGYAEPDADGGPLIEELLLAPQAGDYETYFTALESRIWRATQFLRATELLTAPRAESLQAVYNELGDHPLVLIGTSDALDPFHPIKKKSMAYYTYDVGYRDEAHGFKRLLPDDKILVVAQEVGNRLQAGHIEECIAGFNFDKSVGTYGPIREVVWRRSENARYLHVAAARRVFPDLSRVRVVEASS